MYTHRFIHLPRIKLALNLNENLRKNNMYVQKNAVEWPNPIWPHRGKILLSSTTQQKNQTKIVSTLWAGATKCIAKSLDRI